MPRKIFFRCKFLVLSIIFLLFLLVLFFATYRLKISADSITSSNLHSTGSFEISKQLKDFDFSNSGISHNNSNVQVGITSHHLPTAFTLIANFYRELLNSSGDKKTFIILGPDHFEKCQNYVSTTDVGYLTPFDKLEIDQEISQRLLDLHLASLDNNCFEGEHSIGVQTIFIKYLFPNAKIVPIIFSSSTTDKSISEIANFLSQLGSSVTVITSIDFSHHYEYNQAMLIDSISEDKIKNLNESFFDLEHVDSPAALKIAIILAKKLYSSRPIIIDKANSYDFTGEKDNTTGYFNVIFTK